MTQGTMIQGSVRPLFDDQDFAVLVTPEAPVSDPMSWIAANLDGIQRLGLAHPAMVLRDIGVRNDTDFQRVCSSLLGEPSAYMYRSTPRTEVIDGIMTATEYPASEEILMHCESAYQRDWPLRLAFCCIQPAASGGQTPIADIHALTQALGSELVDEFHRRGVRYIRNYHDGFDLPWQTVFQTDDPRQVEAYCKAQGIDVIWLADGRLRTEQTAQGTAVHPLSGQRLWFNQAHLFHPSALGEDVWQDMQDIFGDDGLPRDARFGDGTPIEPDVLACVRNTFAATARQFDWQAGDVMLVDNMLVAHGRRPFSGARRVLVSMGPMRSTLTTETAQAPGR